MDITNKGKAWERKNSIWILWSFAPFLNYAGFFWIGGRVGKRKWIISGFIYLLLTVLVFIFPNIKIEPFNTLLFNTLVMPLFLAGWAASIIQSFMSRKEYLIRLEAVDDLKNETRDLYRDQIRKDYFGENQPVKSAAPNSQPQKPPAQIQGLNLNTCPEQQIASLPGVGIALAKRAVVLREQNPFVSTADFSQRLGLQPHFAAQIDKMAFAAPSAVPMPEQPVAPSATQSQISGGRIIDI